MWSWIIQSGELPVLFYFAIQFGLCCTHTFSFLMPKSFALITRSCIAEFARDKAGSAGCWIKGSWNFSQLGMHWRQPESAAEEQIFPDFWAQKFPLIDRKWSSTLPKIRYRRRGQENTVPSITKESKQVSMHTHERASKPINQHSIFILQPCKHFIDFLSTQLLRFQKPKLQTKPIFLLSKSLFWLLSDYNILLYHIIWKAHALRARKLLG